MNIVLVVEMIRETEEAGHSFYLFFVSCVSYVSCVSCVAALLLVAACCSFAVRLLSRVYAGTCLFKDTMVNQYFILFYMD